MVRDAYYCWLGRATVEELRNPAPSVPSVLVHVVETHGAKIVLETREWIRLETEPMLSTARVILMCDQGRNV